MGKTWGLGDLKHFCKMGHPTAVLPIAANMPTADSKQHARLGDTYSRKESRRRKSNNFSSLLYTQQQQKCDFLGVTENVFSV